MERGLVIDVAKVYKLWDEYFDCQHSGDIERWISLWIEDGIQMPPDSPRRVGVVQIREAMQSRFDHFILSNTTINTEEVRILGNRAYSHGTFTYNITPKVGGETQFISGKFLEILVKQADGSWKIAIDCQNYNKPAV
jgi:uncharacterized protein (TIGR02246 family)